MKFIEGIWWCRQSFCSPWAAESEYVVYYLIPWTSGRISRLKVKSKAKMALFRTKIFRDEEQHWCWVSFDSSWDAESEYVVYYLIPWTSCRISRLKVKSKATLNEQMALYDGTWIMSVLCSQAGCVHSVNAHAIRHIRACLYIRDKVLMPICGRVLPDISSLWINSRRSGLRLQLTSGPSPYPISAACE